MRSVIWELVTMTVLATPTLARANPSTGSGEALGSSPTPRLPSPKTQTPDASWMNGPDRVEELATGDVLTGVSGLGRATGAIIMWTAFV